MDRYTQIYLKWITCEYSTENSVLCYVAAWMRGVWGRMDTCICMTKSLHCSPETITTLLIGYTPIQKEKKTSWLNSNVRTKNILGKGLSKNEDLIGKR